MTMTADSWSQTLIAVSQSKIRSLVIFSTAISFIPQNFFNSFHNYSPYILNIYQSYGSRDGVHPLAFRNLSKVHGLLISYTNITILKPDYFIGMGQLQMLHIDNCIEAIETSHSMWENKHLWKLDLRYNELREIKQTAFLGLTALEFLYLDYNVQLAVIEITSLSGIKSLRHLSLNETHVQKIDMYVPQLEYLSFASSSLGMWTLSPGKTFKYTKSLTELSLANTGARTNDLYLVYRDLRNVSLFEEMHNLTYLFLRGNRLHVLESGMFWNLLSLEVLDLGDSKISTILLGAFKGLKSLQTLWLDSNMIQEVSYYLLEELQQLRTFHIEQNDIRYLENYLFRNKPFLSSLHLASNHLVGFNQSTLKNISFSLEEIDISDNPIFCDCGTMWLAEWLSGPIEVKHKHDTICSTVSATLTSLRGKPVITLASTELCNPRKETPVFIALTTLSCLTVIVLFVVTYWHRWFLRHKLFLLKLAIIGYKEIEDHRNREEFECDLNIMFTNDCEEWLQQHLRPFLDESFPDMGRMVFGDDDLKLGMHYLDAVLYAVEHSFKTVILLSRAAIQDHWFMLKFRLAMDYATDIGMENIILIFVEDIFDDDELPYLVRLFLSGSGSYLNWVEEEEGQEYFWKQLEKYLNVNRRINHLLPAH